MSIACSRSVLDLEHGETNEQSLEAPMMQKFIRRNQTHQKLT